MPQKGGGLLAKYGLTRNPFTDRTAEKTDLNDTSLYLHADLQNFRPSEETYLFFGKRGSGKTTVRLSMMRTYSATNAELKAAGKPPHFVVDLCKPGHMTACLKDFQEIIGCSMDNWDATFSEQWTCSDLVDCIISYAVTKIVETIAIDDGNAGSREESARMQRALATNPRIAKRLLILSSLYARTDATSLMRMRAVVDKMAWASQLSPLSAPTAFVSTGGLVMLGAVAFALIDGAAAGGSSPSPPQQPSGNFQKKSGSPARSSLSAGDGFLAGVAAAVGEGVNSLIERQGLIAGAGLAACGLTMTGGLFAAKHKKNRKRAATLQEPIRVVKRCSAEELACVLSVCVSPNDTVETVRQVHVGISAHQKLEKLLEVVQLLGYESVCVFGDCFDEIVLLDPQRFPSAIKKFAKEVCMNDLLNFGRMHFFLPDNRLQLDLTTDKTLKEARFDRHYVRDMTWSRHQLEELAEQRFAAAQEKYGNGNGNGGGDKPGISFSELFKEVSGEDFAAFVGQLETPRQLMIMMTEMFNRMEQNPSGKLKAQDMEFAVAQAKANSV